MSEGGVPTREPWGERMNTLKHVILGCTLLFGLAAICQAAEPTIDVLRNQVFVERDSGPLAADVYRPRGAGPFPGMLVVHGGAWRMGARADLAMLAQRLAENGYTAVAIDYRLAPTYKFPAQIYDCQAAIRWMRSHASELKIDPTRIGGRPVPGVPAGSGPASVNGGGRTGESHRESAWRGFAGARGRSTSESDHVIGRRNGPM